MPPIERRYMLLNHIHEFCEDCEHNMCKTDTDTDLELWFYCLSKLLYQIIVVKFHAEKATLDQSNL